MVTGEDHRREDATESWLIDYLLYGSDQEPIYRSIPLDMQKSRIIVVIKKS